MNFQLVLLLVAFAPATNAVSSTNNAQDRTKDSVITKVVQMLAEEKDKIAIDLKAERSQMDEYFNFCHREEDEKNYQIGQANRKIEDLSALIEDNTAQIAELDEEIVDLGTEMAKHVATQKKEDERRANGTAEFKQREMEQTVMVEELQKLEEALELQMAAMTTPPPVEGSAPAEAEALIQRDASNDELLGPGFWASAYQQAKVDFANRQKRMSQVQVQKLTPEEARTRATQYLQQLGTDEFDAQTIRNLRTTIGAALSAVVEAEYPGSSHAFVQQEAEAGEDAAPATQTISAAHYDMAKKNNEANLEAFKGLKEKAEQALQRERDQEAEDQHNYMLDKQARVQEMNVNEDKTEEAKSQRAHLTEEKAAAQKELADVQTTKDADMKYLKVLLTECTAGSNAWDHRQQEASDEQAAIMKAMEILSSRVKVLVQVHREGLLQVDNKQPAQEKTQMQEAKLRQTLINQFRNLGTKLHSLSMLNMVSAASVQPMDKVKGLIKELIQKLQKEAADAASTHAWCEEENKKNKEAKEKTSDKLKTLEIRLDKADAQKAALSDDIEALTEAIAEIDASDAEATKIRNEEHTSFLKAEGDFKEAASAVLDAIDALKDYYGDTVFLQMEKIETTTTSPIRFQAPDLGGAKKDSAGGVLSILDMMASNFAKTVSELQSNEREKKKAFEKMTNDNAVSKASKEAEVKGAESEIASLTVAAGHAADDKTMTQDEMNALLEYIDKLKPTCVGTVMSYAERKAKREAEIEGLKQALNLLEETQGTLSTVSFLQVRRHQEML